LRDLVYAPLRDSERSFIEPWFVDALLNEAYLDINARLRIKQKVQSGTTSSTGTIPYPSDCIEEMALWIGTNPVSWVDNDKFKSWAEPGSETPFVIIARVFNQTIETYPIQVSRAYEFEYVSRPTPMVAEGDCADILHRELQIRLVNYARAHCKWQEGEEAEGQRYMAMYEDGLPAAPRMQYNLRPGPITLIPDAGPFD